MALDDFADPDDEALGGLDDLFDEPSTSVAPARTAAESRAADTVDEPLMKVDAGDAPASSRGRAVEAPDADSTEKTHFLDDAAIDEELLSSVEDVLSELGDLEQDDENMFGLHSELGVPEHRSAAAVDDRPSAFPDIFPVEGLESDELDAYDASFADHAYAESARRKWLPTISILIANFVLLLFAWSASRSLHSGLQDVRNELDDVRTTALSPATTRISTFDPITGVDAGAAQPNPEALRAEPDMAPPLPTFDQVALEIAQREVERGLYTSARRRLYALLVLADRIEKERRSDVEALTSLRIADSYRIEARARREVTQ